MKKSEPAGKKLAQSDIVHAALEILRAEGIDKLTMRRLAERLHVKGASLYWHIRDKQELLGMIAEEVCRAISFPDERLPWEERLLEFAKRCRSVYLRMPNSVHALVETPPSTPYRLELIRRVNELFEQAGFTREDGFSAGWMLNNYMTSFLLDEYRIASMEQKPGYPMPDPEREFVFGIEVLIAGFKSKLNG